jgi:hypothetical protein
VPGPSGLASGGNGLGSRVPLSCAFAAPCAKNRTAHNASAAGRSKPGLREFLDSLTCEHMADWLGTGWEIIDRIKLLYLSSYAPLIAAM